MLCMHHLNTTHQNPTHSTSYNMTHNVESEAVHKTASNLEQAGELCLETIKPHDLLVVGAAASSPSHANSMLDQHLAELEAHYSALTTKGSLLIAQLDTVHEGAAAASGGETSLNDRRDHRSSFFFKKGDDLLGQPVPKHNRSKPTAVFSDAHEHNHVGMARRLAFKGVVVGAYKPLRVEERVALLNKQRAAMLAETDDVGRVVAYHKNRLLELRQSKLEEREMQRRARRNWRRSEQLDGYIPGASNDLTKVDFDKHFDIIKMAAAELGFTWDREKHEAAQKAHSDVKRFWWAQPSTYRAALGEELVKRESGTLLAEGEAIASLCSQGALGRWDEVLAACRTRLFLHSFWASLASVATAAQLHEDHNARCWADDDYDCVCSVNAKPGAPGPKGPAAAAAIARPGPNGPAAAAANAVRRRLRGDQKEKATAAAAAAAADNPEAPLDAKFEADRNPLPVDEEWVAKWTSRGGYWSGYRGALVAANKLEQISHGKLISSVAREALRDKIRHFNSADPRSEWGFVVDADASTKYVDEAHANLAKVGVSQATIIEQALRAFRAEFDATSVTIKRYWDKLGASLVLVKEREKLLVRSAAMNMTYDRYLAKVADPHSFVSETQFHSHIPRSSFDEFLTTGPIYEHEDKFSKDYPMVCLGVPRLFGFESHEYSVLTAPLYATDDRRSVDHQNIKPQVAANRLYQVLYTRTRYTMLGPIEHSEIQHINDTLFSQLVSESGTARTRQEHEMDLRARASRAAVRLNVPVGKESQDTIFAASIFLKLREVGNARAMSWCTGTLMVTVCLLVLAALLRLSGSSAEDWSDTSVNQSHSRWAKRPLSTETHPAGVSLQLTWKRNSTLAPSVGAQPPRTFPVTAWSTSQVFATTSNTSSPATTSPPSREAYPQSTTSIHRARQSMGDVVYVQATLSLISAVLCGLLFWRLWRRSTRRPTCAPGLKVTTEEQSQPRNSSTGEAKQL